MFPSPPTPNSLSESNEKKKKVLRGGFKKLHFPAFPTARYRHVIQVPPIRHRLKADLEISQERKRLWGYNAVAEASKDRANSNSHVECFHGDNARKCHLINLIRGLVLSTEPASPALRPYPWSALPTSSAEVFLSYLTQGGSIL